MRIVELKNLAREEGYIYYRRNFSALAVVEIPGSTIDAPVNFCIETNPLGNKAIEISITANLNYPLLPVKKALQEYILLQDNEGKLP